MTNIKRIWAALLGVCVISFGILLYIGAEIYHQAPPIPEKIVTPSGKVVFTQQDIEQGQLVWRSMGGHQIGSIWGHGSLLAPDWNADWLHREALLLMEQYSLAEKGLTYEQLNDKQKSYYKAQLVEEIRHNSYNPNIGTIVISEQRANVINQLSNYYSKLFGDHPELASLREQYALKENTIPDADRRDKLAAFFFWSTWATVTNRPDKDISYTSNWPHEPLVDNVPGSGVLAWSIFSIVFLI